MNEIQQYIDYHADYKDTEETIRNIQYITSNIIANHEIDYTELIKYESSLDYGKFSKVDITDGGSCMVAPLRRSFMKMFGYEYWNASESDVHDFFANIICLMAMFTCSGRFKVATFNVATQMFMAHFRHKLKEIWEKVALDSRMSTADMCRILLIFENMEKDGMIPPDSKHFTQIFLENCIRKTINK
jgi:hypothetical protein